MFEFDPKKKAYRQEWTMLVTTLSITAILLLTAIGIWLIMTWR